MEDSRIKKNDNVKIMKALLNINYQFLQVIVILNTALNLFYLAWYKCIYFYHSQSKFKLARVLNKMEIKKEGKNRIQIKEDII